MANRTLEMAIALRGRLDSSLGGAVRAATSQLRNLDSTIRNLDSQANNLNDRFHSGAISGEEFASQMADLVRQLEEAQDSQNNLTHLVENYGNAMSRFEGRAKAFGVAVGAMTAMAAPIAMATNEAIKFENVMADVRKVVDFENEGQFKGMSDSIIELSQRLPMAAEGIAQIVAAGGQAGIAKDELMGFAESATKMGIAFDVTADEAGEMMAKWRTAFKLGQNDVVNLADKINYLGNTTAASAPLISDVVTRIGPLGEIGGVASGEIAALGASMVSTGVQSDVAATGIKNLILGMVAGEGATKSQSAAFQQLGMDASAMAQRMQTDARGAIMDVFKAIQNLDKYQQATVLSDLFGKESIDAIAPLLSNLGALEDNFRKVADASQYAGSMEAEYAARSATTDNQIQLMKNSLRAVAINIGNAVLPALKGLLDMVAPIISAVANWTAQNQGLVKVILGLAFAIGSVITIGLGIATVSAAWEALSAAMALSAATGEGSIAVMTLLGIRTRISAAATMLHAKANAIFGASMAALRSPVTTFGNLIGALPARLTALRAAIVGIPTMISGAFTTAFAGLATVGLPVIAAVLAIVAVIALVAANFDKLKETASIVFGHISGTVSAMVATVQAKFDEALGKITEVINSITGQSMQSSELIGAIFNNLGFVIGAAFDVAAGIVGTAISVIINLVASVAQIIGGVVNIVVGLFTGDWNRAWQGAGQAVEGFAGGTIGTLKTIAGGIGDIFDTLMGKADEVESRAKTAMAASPVVDNQAAIAAAQQMSTATADASANAQTLAANTQQAGVEAQQASGYMEQLQGVMQNLPAASQGAFDGIGTASSNAAQTVQTNLQQIPANTQAIFQQLPPMAQQGTDGIAQEFGQLAAKCQPGGEAFAQGANTWGQQAYQNIANWADQMAAVVVDRLSNAWSQISAQFSAGLNVNVTTTSSVVPHAEGGIFSSPHLGLVAEAGVTEAVIPLDRSQRSLDLYSEAGKMMGIPSLASAGSGSGGGTFTFAPTINVSGNASSEEIKNVLQSERDRFEAWFRDMQSRDRRLSLA